MGEIIQRFPNNLEEYIGNCDVAKYLQRYLSKMGAQSYVVEENYIDKDYLVDFQGFYSRSFEQYKRFTIRIHFFNENYSDKDFQNLIKGYDVDELQNTYLGFIVVKPVYDMKGNPLIGRTVLKHYPKEDGTSNRFFIEPTSHCNLYGIPLQLQSLPFQSQDSRVSACATIALWTSLFPLFDFFEIKKQSPSEITRQSTLFPAPSRKFPASGLTMEQILSYIGQLGLDSEVLIGPEGEKIALATKAYIKEAKLPVLALLKLSDSHGGNAYHAVVISGYKCDKNGEVVELYIHDDQIGPYHRVKPTAGDFRSWGNEWITRYNKTGVEVEYLIIPIYQKIRLTFPRILAFYEKYRDDFHKSNPSVKTELFLTCVQKYKKFLAGENIENKWENLTSSMPRFIWVIRNYYDEKILVDTLFDATSVFAKPLKSIDYIVS